MSESNKITRREAIRYMGVAAASATLGVGVVNAIGGLGQNFTNRTMKVLLVNGSPNKEGCTYTALSEVAATLNKNGIDTEILWIGKQAISSCLGCGACSESGRCFIKDCTNDFLDKAPDFDGFVFGSPVHFAAMTGSMASFMQRAFFCARSKNDLAGKPAATLASCRRSGTTTVLDQLNKYPIHRGMPLVPSQYWPMVYGNTPDEVRQDAEGLQILRTMGQNMAWMLKCIDIGKQNGLSFPDAEKRVSTNFIR